MLALSLSCAAAVAFEDFPVGIRAARAAGVRCVAVPSSVGDRTDLRQADLVLKSVLAYALPIAPAEPVDGARFGQSPRDYSEPLAHRQHGLIAQGLGSACD